MIDPELDVRWMSRAIELAQRGEGSVEPNPMVGCVLATGDRLLGEGWHERFGGPHAEVVAMQSARGPLAGATAYVTLEPCCHFGKTPPCTQAIVAAGIKRVVVAHPDPFPAVNGGGMAQLRAAGIVVETGLLADRARAVLAPYLKRQETGLPWVLGKWAMTLDGKIASRSGDSRWISNELSRQRAHQLRGRVDAILVGRGTVDSDNPRLTARPHGPRTALRVVLDARASLSCESQLARSLDDGPVLVVATAAAPPENLRRLKQAGVEVLIDPTPTSHDTVDWRWLLGELGRRGMTNVLVEGGGTVLGSLFDGAWIDEVHVFIAPKLLGGATAPSPLGGLGIDQMPQIQLLQSPQISLLQGDIYLRARVRRPPAEPVQP